MVLFYIHILIYFEPELAMEVGVVLTMVLITLYTSPMSGIYTCTLYMIQYTVIYPKTHWWFISIWELLKKSIAQSTAVSVKMLNNKKNYIWKIISTKLQKQFSILPISNEDVLPWVKTYLYLSNMNVMTSYNSLTKYWWLLILKLGRGTV